MLHFFPEPYEDEVFYSIIARYFYYSGSTSFFVTRSHLFNGITACPIYLPKNLDFLTSKLPNGAQLNNDYFIYNTSVLPLYIPFVSVLKMDEIKTNIIGSEGSPYTKLGLAKNNEKEYLSLYYCPLCCLEDVKTYAEPYFHRTHQAPGVMVCHMHGCLLEKYPCISRDLSRGSLIRAEEHKMMKVPRYERDSILGKELYDVAASVNQLLIMGQKGFNINVTVQLYRKKLYDLGYFMDHGYIKKSQVIDDFFSSFSPQLLDRLNVSKESYSWLDRVFLNPDGKMRAALNPTKHILIIQFLFGSMDNFIKSHSNEDTHHNIHDKNYENGRKDDYCKTFSFFGKGPWPCLNSVADHYGSLVINSCTLTNKCNSGEVVGLFKCSCGYSYLAEPITNTEKSLRKYRVISYGEAWNQVLSRYITDEEVNDIHKLARLMKCNETAIVTNARRLGLLDKLQVSEPYTVCTMPSHNIRGNRIAYHRTIVESLIKIHGIVTKEMINQYNPTTYVYLAKHDKQWLDEHTHKYNYWIEKRKAIDWNTIDGEISKLLSKAYSDLINNPSPARITQTKLTEAIGKKDYILRNKAFLPNTLTYLENHIESREEYQVRQIKVACENLHKKGLNINMSSILQEIGYSYDYLRHRSEVVTSYFKSQIVQYNGSNFINTK